MLKQQIMLHHIIPRSKKAVVHIVTSGIVVDFIEILLRCFPEITNVKVFGKDSTVSYSSLIFDEKPIAPGVER